MTPVSAPPRLPNIALLLWGRLAVGDVPDWLERIETDGSPLAVYRVKHQKYEAD
jgi:hypothetical protein